MSIMLLRNDMLRYTFEFSNYEELVGYRNIKNKRIFSCISKISSQINNSISDIKLKRDIFEPEKESNIMCLSFFVKKFKSETFLVGGFSDHLLRMINIKTGKLEYSFEAHTTSVKFVLDISTNENELIIATSGLDHRIKIWNLINKQWIQTVLFKFNLSYLTKIEFKENSPFLSFSLNRKIVFYSIKQNREVMSFKKGHTQEINQIISLNDYKKGYFGSCGDDGKIVIWKFTNKNDNIKLIMKSKNIEQINYIQYSVNNFLLSDCEHNHINVWDLATGLILRTIHSGSDCIIDLHYLNYKFVTPFEFITFGEDGLVNIHQLFKNAPHKNFNLLKYNPIKSYFLWLNQSTYYIFISYKNQGIKQYECFFS